MSLRVPSERPAACARLGLFQASGGALAGFAVSLTIALLCSTLLKPFLQERRRACHSVKPGLGRKVTMLPPSTRAGGAGEGVGLKALSRAFVVGLVPDPLMSPPFSCQSTLMEVNVVTLLHILISCSREAVRPSSGCLASADPTGPLYRSPTMSLQLVINMLEMTQLLRTQPVCPHTQHEQPDTVSPVSADAESQNMLRLVSSDVKINWINKVSK